MAELRRDARVQLAHRVSRGLGLAVALIGVLVIVGWTFDVATLKSVAPAFPVMKPNTAISLILVGIGLRLRAANGSRRWIAVSGMIVGLLAVLSIVEHVTGANLGIDELVFRDSSGSFPPGRMAFATAVCLTLLSIGLVTPRASRWTRLGDGAALLALVASMFAVLGYLFGVERFYTVGPFGATAFHSALALLLAAVAAIFANPTNPVVELLVSDTAGGVLVRRLLPASIVLPAVLGWVRLQGEQTGLYNTVMGLALYAASNIVCFAVLTLASGAKLERSAAALAESQARLDRIARSGVVGIITAENGTIVEANDMFLELLGYTREDLAQGRIRGIDLTPPEWREADERAREQLKTHAAVPPFEKELFRKDGRRVPIMISVTKLDPPRVICLVSDLTDKKAEERSRLLLESAPDSTVIMRADGRIQLVNAQTERLFGYARDELIGQPVEVLIPGEHELHRAELLADSPAHAMRTGAELRAVRRDGVEMPVEITLSLVDTPDGALVSASIRDITARKLLDAKLQEASRLKSEFVANMSHELRTPLNAIIGFSELMARGRAGPVSPEHAEYLGDILHSSRHLLGLINDVLDLAKVESGKMELEPVPIDLAKLVGETTDVARGLATTRRIKIETYVEPELDAVADPARIKQVLYNYLSNAIKFAPEGSTVTVRIVPAEDNMVRIDVVDVGIGIAEADLPRLFVEFQQIDASTSKRYQGTGLGLALTKRIVEVHGGRVEVKSILGKGSTFSAIIPRTPRAVDAA